MYRRVVGFLDVDSFSITLVFASKVKNLHYSQGEPLLDKGEGPLARRLATFTVDDPAVTLVGRESIYRNGEPVGWLTSGGWGYTVGKNIGYGYVRHDEGVTDEFLFDGDYQLEVATVRVPCTIHRRALYDPHMDRVRT